MASWICECCNKPTDDIPLMSMWGAVCIECHKVQNRFLYGSDDDADRTRGLRKALAGWIATGRI